MYQKTNLKKPTMEQNLRKPTMDAESKKTDIAKRCFSRKKHQLATKNSHELESQTQEKTPARYAYWGKPRRATGRCTLHDAAAKCRARAQHEETKKRKTFRGCKDGGQAQTTKGGRAAPQ